MGRGLLGRRIIGQAGNSDGHMGSYHPVAPQPMTMPLSVVYVSGDATVVEEAAPLVMGHGETVPATGAGQWDQIRVPR